MINSYLERGLLRRSTTRSQIGRFGARRWCDTIGSGHDPGFVGPHDTQIDPVSGMATFYCNGCPSTHLSPFEKPGPPGALAADQQRVVDVGRVGC